MKKLNKFRIFSILISVIALTASACGPAGDLFDADWPMVAALGKADSGRSDSASVEITRVWHGGTAYRHDGQVILAEGVEIMNTGNKVVDLYGWSLTDLTEGGSGRWAGEAIVGIYHHITLRPGQSLIFANHHHVTVMESNAGYRPISFFDSYNIEPDYTIGHIGSKEAVREAKGQFRLVHEAQTWTGVSQDERVWLLRASDLTLEELAWHLESRTLPLELIASEFPAPALRLPGISIDLAAGTFTVQFTGAADGNFRIIWGFTGSYPAHVVDANLDSDGSYQATFDLDQAALDAYGAGESLWIRAYYTSPASEVGPWNVVYVTTR